MKMNALYAAISGAFLLGAATIAPAQSPPSNAASKAATPDRMENKSQGISRDEYKREKDRVEADAKSAKEKCKSMKDNAKDICEAEAKGTEKVAKKELDYKKNPNDKNRADVEKMKAEAAYEVAKEKCEDQKGAEMASCKKSAKADKDRALAALKGNRKTVASADGKAARSGSTAGNTGGSATGSSATGSGTSATPSGTSTPSGSATGSTSGTKK